MKILIIGSGGREHTIAWKIAQSKRVDKIYCAPGNGGTAEIAENIDIDVDNIPGLLNFAKENKIDLTIVGPELPLVLGIVDEFEKHDLRIFGVNRESAQLEGSKDFSKRFMEKYNIATAKYKAFTDLEEASLGLREFSYPLVIKADGLCAGKGVIICQDENDALETLESIMKEKVFGCQGDKIIIEEFLDGIEVSLLCLVTGNKIIPMESAKDYKKIYDGDKGPNTGGVGCCSPSPILTDELKTTIEKNILNNIIHGLEKEKMDFRGVLFIGLMIVDNKPMVLEFNTRFGDPETEVILPRLESDLVDIMEKTIDGTLDKSDLKWTDLASTTVVLTSEGYPGKFEKGFEITGLEKLEKEIIVFHNGSKREDSKLVTNGGRVLSITSLGKDVKDASDKIYKNLEEVNFLGIYYRKDIGL